MWIKIVFFQILVFFTLMNVLIMCYLYNLCQFLKLLLMI